MMRMKARILGYIAQKINRLTNDEDLRQELWVFFLEGNSPFLLEHKLNSIKIENMKHDDTIMYVSMETLDGLKTKL